MLEGNSQTQMAQSCLIYQSKYTFDLKCPHEGNMSETTTLSEMNSPLYLNFEKMLAAEDFLCDLVRSSVRACANVCGRLCDRVRTYSVN